MKLDELFTLIFFYCNYFVHSFSFLEMEVCPYVLVVRSVLKDPIVLMIKVGVYETLKVRPATEC